MKKLHPNLKSAVKSALPDKELLRRSVKEGTVLLPEPKKEGRLTPFLRALGSAAAVLAVFAGILIGAAFLRERTTPSTDPFAGTQVDTTTEPFMTLDPSVTTEPFMTLDPSMTTEPVEELPFEGATSWEEILEGVLSMEIVISERVDVEDLTSREFSNITTREFYEATGCQLFRKGIYGIYCYDGESLDRVTADYLVREPIPLRHGELNGMLLHHGRGSGIVHEFLTYYDFTTKTAICLIQNMTPGFDDPIAPSENGLPLSSIPVAFLHIEPSFRENGDVLLALYTNSAPFPSEELTLTHHGTLHYRAETGTWSYLPNS